MQDASQTASKPLPVAGQTPGILTFAFNKRIQTRYCITNPCFSAFRPSEAADFMMYFLHDAAIFSSAAAGIYNPDSPSSQPPRMLIILVWSVLSK